MSQTRTCSPGAEIDRADEFNERRRRVAEIRASAPPEAGGSSLGGMRTQKGGKAARDCDDPEDRSMSRPARKSRLVLLDGGRALPTRDGNLLPETARAGLKILRHGEAAILLSSIFNAISNPLFVKDEQHRFVFVNDAFCAMHRRSRAEILGCDVLDLDIPAEQAGFLWQKDSEVFATGLPNEHEEALTDGNGTLRWILTRKSIVHLADGRRCLVGVISDITERNRAEDLLAESERQKAIVLASALDAIISIDADGCITEFNPAAEKISGYARDAAIGRPISDLIPTAQFRPDASNENARQFIVGQRIEVTAVRADGSEFPAELSISAATPNAPLRLTAFLRDITERKRGEAKLLDAIFQAEAASWAKLQSAANLSHDCSSVGK